MSTPADTRSSRAAAMMLRWGGWCVVLACVFLRALVGTETLPYWDVDPTRVITTPTGLTPAGSMIVNVLILAGVAAALIGEAIIGAGVSLRWTALALVGAAGVCVHGFVIDGGSLDQLNIGATWIAAIAGGLGAMHICRDARLRRLTLALCIGLVAMLTAKGVLQVGYEHGITLAQYRADPQQFLASQGWTKDSAAARAFERRLSQAEATGWFGLSNVYATFAAGGMIALVGWSVLGWRRARDADRLMPDGWAGVLTIGAIGAIAAVVMAGSKGGATVAAIGLSLLAGSMLLRRQMVASLAPILTPRAGGLLALALVLSAIGALVVRGAVGERVGELSLLFRWFYIRGAMRIFAEHPLFGVGPAGFKDAYMLAKPPQSPEEVVSPHSVMFDYLGTLGLFGIAWVTLWLGWVYALGREIARGALRREPEGAPAVANAEQALTEPRVELWLVLVVSAAPVLVSAWMERGITTPDAAVTRVAGMAGWIGVSLAGLALARIDGLWRWIAAVAALAMAVHGQIEVTPVWAGSATLYMVMVASCGGGPSLRRIAFSWLDMAPGVALAALAIGLAVFGAGPTWHWERDLAAGADQVRPLAQVAMRFDELAANRGQSPTGDTPQRIAADAAALIGASPPQSPAEFDHLMNQLTVRLTSAASPYLESATRLAPRHVPTAEALCRNRLATAAAELALGQPGAAAALGEETSRWAEAFVAALPHPSASAWALLGTVWSSRAEIQRQPELLNQAVTAWSRASVLDPYGLTFPLRIFRALKTVGPKEELKTWAGRVLELDALQRLDPLRGLTPDERQDAERAANDP